MKFSLAVVLLAIGLVSAQTSQNVERECDCTLSGYWLDIVIAIDTSTGMGSDGIIQVAADAFAVLTFANISQSLGQTVRVAIVTYSSTATTYADLTAYNSLNDFAGGIYSIQPSGITTSNVNSALNMASTIFKSGRASGTRNNVKQALLIYATDYQKDGNVDPVKTAQGLQGDGVSIITVSFNQGGGVVAGLSQLANPGMAFSNSDGNGLVGEIQGALCQINCFCTNKWTQYIYNGGASGSKKMGTCAVVAKIQTNWMGAKYACEGLAPNAYLASEFDSGKHAFLVSQYLNDTTNNNGNAFFIGLSNDGTGWKWEQPKGQPLLPLSGGSYNIWSPGYPTSSPTLTCGYDGATSSGSTIMRWMNDNCYSVTQRYACQLTACDTANYCATIDN